MKKTYFLAAIILAFILVACSAVNSTTINKDKGRSLMEEKIWILEEAYFSNLYKANYDGVLAISHNQFLGWPDASPQPVDKKESALFMKKLIPKPTSCTFKIKRAGIRMFENMALTQYLIYVNCTDAAGVKKTQTSRITHTWIRVDSGFQLLGGMSKDQ